MAHPKSRISKAKRNQRRANFKATAPTLASCSLTGEMHKFHHAYWRKVSDDTQTDEQDDDATFSKELIYRGQVVMRK